MEARSQFSDREMQVIALLLLGKSNKQIALALGISARTVEFHLKNVYSKLRVSSRTEAVLQLGKSRGTTTPDSLGESAVVGVGGRAENSGRPGSTWRLPMRTYVYIGGVSLLAIALILFLASSNLFSGGVDTPGEVTGEATATSLGVQSTQTFLPPTETASVPQVSAEDVAHFVSENYPDGSHVAPATRFTKTWTLQNIGTTTWGPNYSLVLTEGSYPLGDTQAYPHAVNLPHEVKPGATVEVTLDVTAPNSDAIWELHYRLQNPRGQFASGDGNEVWLRIAVGEAQFPARSTGSSGVTIELISVNKNETSTNVEVCAQLPDTLDWNFNDVVLTAGNVRNSLSGLSLQNPKDARTYSSAYRCYLLEFPVGVSNYGASTVTVTIGNIRVPAENDLETNCARAKLQLASQYPALDFTCGPAGFFYSNLQLPSGMNRDQANAIIMDALERAIYGPWVLTE